MAEEEPETVQGLLRNEIANNWIVETSLSIADAREKCRSWTGQQRPAPPARTRQTKAGLQSSAGQTTERPEQPPC